jgi:acetyl esterase
MSSIDVQRLAGATASVQGPTLDVLARADADMRHLLTLLQEMGGRPLERLTPEQARMQPGLPDAMHRVLRGRSDEAGIAMEFRMIPGPGGDIRARVYTPTIPFAAGKAPLILFIHGGGWVVGDLEGYDGTARALARRAGAVVVSTHYRQAPEHPFPAAHEDTYAAWLWMAEHAAALGGDARRMAVAGEGAGGNMAFNIAIRARDEKQPVPIHQVLITPMAGTDLTLPSYEQNLRSVPISTSTVRWFYEQLLGEVGDRFDPRLNLSGRADLPGLKPTTIILAELDPLRSEGEALAGALRRSGVWVECTLYDGVTHQFFGVGGIVNKGMFAQGQVGRNLTEAFSA